jgi:hypothetical protein
MKGGKVYFAAQNFGLPPRLKDTKGKASLLLLRNFVFAVKAQRKSLILLTLYTRNPKGVHLA